MKIMLKVCSMLCSTCMNNLPLPIYKKTAELSFGGVFSIRTSNLKPQMICIRTPFDVKETSSFNVDLTKLDNIKYLIGNYGEKNGALWSTIKADCFKGRQSYYSEMIFQNRLAIVKSG